MQKIGHTGHIAPKGNKFSLKARFKSFTYAFEGIAGFLKYEHNIWIHLVATVAAIILSIILKINASEAIAITLVICFVWTAELFNTAIERMADLISIEKDPRIKIIKDVAAAGVLLAAVAALVVGSIVFIPKII